MDKDYGSRGGITWEWAGDEYRNRRFQIGPRDVAWYVVGYEVEADENTEWTGYYNRTGLLVVTMVGDDSVRTVEPSDLKEIGEDEYCGGCGQIGCGHGG